MQKPNSIIVFYTFFIQSTKDDTSHWLFKSLKMPHWAGKLIGRLCTPHDNPISAADIGL